MNLGLLFPLAGLLTLAACASERYYVDPQYHLANYGDLKRVSRPYVLVVRVDSKVAGVDAPETVRPISDRVDRSLRASGIAVPYDGHAAADGELDVNVNVTSDKAAAKGVESDLTFGLVGNLATDTYQVSMHLAHGATNFERQYKHVIVTQTGRGSPPPNVQPVPKETAVDQVMDDVVLNFLRDVQSTGKLTTRN